MNIYRVYIADIAFDEIKSQFYYIHEKSPQAAANWLRNIYAAIDTLERFPRRCSLARENDHVEDELRQLIFKKNWRIIFTVADDVVHVLRVRHGRQVELGEVHEPTEGPSPE